MINELTPQPQDYISKNPVTIPEGTDCQVNSMPLSDYKLLLESLFEKFEKKYPADNKIF